VRRVIFFSAFGLAVADRGCDPLEGLAAGYPRHRRQQPDPLAPSA
jgi:hypothetical protein